jgi:hypothetical protein
MTSLGPPLPTFSFTHSRRVCVFSILSFHTCLHLLFYNLCPFRPCLLFSLTFPIFAPHTFPSLFYSHSPTLPFLFYFILFLSFLPYSSCYIIPFTSIFITVSPSLVLNVAAWRLAVDSYFEGLGFESYPGDSSEYFILLFSHITQSLG